VYSTRNQPAQSHLIPLFSSFHKKKKEKKRQNFKKQKKNIKIFLKTRLAQIAGV